MMIYYNHGLAILTFLWALFSSNSNAVITTITPITKPNGAPKNFFMESISPSTATSSQTSIGNPQDVTEITSENVTSTEARNLNTTKKANEFGTTEKLSETRKTSALVADHIEPTSSKSRKKSATATTEPYDYSRSRNSRSGDSESESSETSTATADNGAGKRMAFGVLMVISLFFMILQIWFSIFGHRMQLHPVRWHTLHYNCWNIFQLVVFADTDSNSPYAGFLHNSNIDTGVNNLQKLTFTAFMSSWIVITPFILVAYYAPNVFKNRFTQWIIWMPIYAILNIISITFCFAGNFMDSSNDIFNAYHMGITGLFMIFLLVSIVFTIVSLVVFIVHSIMYCINTRKHSTKFLPHAYDFLHLLFKLIYYIVSFYTIMPYNSKTMVDYLIRVIGLATLMNWMNWAFQNLANIMPTLMDIFQSLLNQAAWCALMIPIGEFFTTFIWIEMYREQYVWLLSCGRFYKDKTGQNLTKQPIRATTMVIEPRQLFLVANPDAVAPTNGGWVDPILQTALNTDLNAKFIPVSNTATLQQNWASNGQDSRKGNKYSFTNLNQLGEET